MELTNHEKNREFLATVYTDMPKAEQMLKADPQFLHYRSSVGETPFHYLVIENEVEKAAKLLDWGADINTQDNFGATPLSRAIMLGNLNLVKWLVQQGASLEPKDINGETALAYATSNEKAAIFQFLISLPRKHPIDAYYDDLTARGIYDNEELVMRSHLIELGLTKRFDDL
jgi:ankyrin repeat protein